MKKRKQINREKFCLAIAANKTPAEAYVEAGSTTKSKAVAASAGNRLLQDVEVKKRLKQLSKEYKTEKILSIQEIQEGLTKIAKQAAEEEVIVVEGCGDGLSEAVIKKKKAALKDVLKAYELLAKMQGGLVNNVNVNGSVPIVIKDDLHE